MKKQITLIIIAIFAVSLNINSQESQEKEKKLSITVKDSNNKPVPGAIILFDDVRQKRWTNSKGVYKTKITKNPKEISAFSPTIGIKKIAYTGNTKIVIIIKEGNDLDLTENHKSKNLNAVQYRDIYDYLRGQVPGVIVDGNNSIKIRGYSTINGNTTPLFILNNSPIDNASFGNIVPTTIKSIVILKGPETAIYGARGANGVIDVTTL